LPYYLAPILCSLVAFTLLTGNTKAAADDTATQTSKVVTVFWGIVSYTRWPSEKGALRACLPEDNKYAAAIRDSARVVNLGRKIIVRSTPSDVVSACDVVYFPARPSGETGSLLRDLKGASAMLTIGEGRMFCSAGGMFCLLPDGKGGNAGDITARFAANLDAISRSLLRINPQVLRLSKRGREQ
jgi:hypothetical protein